MNWCVIIPLIIMFGCLLIRVPIAYCMIAAIFSYFLLIGQGAGQVVHIVVNNIFSNYVLIAVPLFVFTANVMNTGAVTEKIFKFCNGLLGRKRGGTAYVNVLASLIFSGMTGSAIADASGLGIMEVEQMRKEGYDDGFSAALTAATAVIGPIFPPSIPFVVYSLVSGASIGKLFMGGIVPALFIAVALSVYVWYVSKKRNYPKGEEVTRKQFWKQTLNAVPALFTPVILLVGIYTGVMTPTEAGGVAAAYSIILSVFVYRSMGLKELWRIITDTAKSVGQLGLIVAAGYGFCYIVAAEHLADSIAAWLIALTNDKYVFLLIINIAFFIMGMFLETSTMQLIVIPLILPAVKVLGIDLVHFGIVVTLNMMIGLLTPPYGMLLFVTSGVSKTPVKPIIKELYPMIAVEVIVLLIITYFPNTVMFIPNLLLG